MLSKKTISKTVVELLRRAEVSLPGDVEEALERAYKNETENIAGMQLKAILDNVKYARENNVPMCQDTGIPVFYLRIWNMGDMARDMAWDLIVESIRCGVKKATIDVPLRPNAVHPLTRENSGDNCGVGIPVIDVDIVWDMDADTNRDAKTTGKGNYLEIIVFPKGAGSENMSSFEMLNPSDGVAGIKRFVIDAVAHAGGNPCPPTIVGVGIGGTADGAMKMAKKALLRKINSGNKNKEMEKLEKELLSEINKLGVGPMGLGGKTTSLAVNIEYAYCHTASLPVAVNLQCWANRRATARIYRDRVEFL